MCRDGAAVLLLLASCEIQKFRSHESRVEHLRMVRYLIAPALQAVVFGYEHDAILRAHLKRRADIKACCSGPGLQEILGGIAEDADKEYGKKDDNRSKAAAADEEEPDAVMTIPVLADLQETKKLVKSFEGDESARKKIDYYKGYAHRLIETYVQLCPETASDDNPEPVGRVRCWKSSGGFEEQDARGHLLQPQPRRRVVIEAYVPADSHHSGKEEII